MRQPQGDRACAVARRLTRKGWPLAANPWRALRKCNVRIGHAHSSPAKTSDFLWILDSGFRRQIAGATPFRAKFFSLFEALNERAFRSCSSQRVDFRWSSDWLERSRRRGADETSSGRANNERAQMTGNRGEFQMLRDRLCTPLARWLAFKKKHEIMPLPNASNSCGAAIKRAKAKNHKQFLGLTPALPGATTASLCDWLGERLL